jgi:hypothetical protein
MTQYGTWVSYGGDARTALCLGLIGGSGVVAYAGTRLRRPHGTSWPGKRAATFMVVGWVLAIAAFLTGLGFYAAKEVHDFPGMPPLTDHILPVTLTAALLTIGIILVGSDVPPRTRLTGAVIAAMAAPMVFELPFDLVVLGRTYPPLPPDPALYRAVFFVPLFLLEVSTIALLLLTPMVRLTRATFYGFALMLAVFAIWAATVGFSYPSTAAPITLNIVGKLLAFATTLTLFFPSLLPRGLRMHRSKGAGSHAVHVSDRG